MNVKMQTMSVYWLTKGNKIVTLHDHPGSCSILSANAKDILALPYMPD
uniref:Uncharacterized protein n=1 Tax=Rhizophora mucronata TaxID=61149 RepID=A0A2P2QC27_RHIMU